MRTMFTAAERARIEIDEEDPNIEAEARKIFGATTDVWLDQQNTLFHGRAPRSLIGTDAEDELRQALRALKYGAFS